jgi:hypothetical protein
MAILENAMRRLIVDPDLVVLGGLYGVVGPCRAGYRLLLQLSMYVCV